MSKRQPQERRDAEQKLPRSILLLAALGLCGNLLSCGGGGAPAPIASRERATPPSVDAEAAVFNDPQRPHVERIEALQALRRRRETDPAEYRRAYDLVKDRLWIEASLADGLSLSALEEKAFVEAVGWLADMKDVSARFKLELHLDRESVRRKRLPDPALTAAALGLANYPESESARETLWAALKDPKEAPVVRSSCLKALQAHHPRDLEARVAKLAAAPEDEWLRSLQRKLR